MSLDKWKEEKARKKEQKRNKEKQNIEKKKFNDSVISKTPHANKNISNKPTHRISPRGG